MPSGRAPDTHEGRRRGVSRRLLRERASRDSVPARPDRYGRNDFRHRRRGIHREPLGVEMLEHRLPAVTSLLSAGLAASCCILPMAFIAAGLASAGLIMSMMRYEWLPLRGPAAQSTAPNSWNHRRRCVTVAARLPFLDEPAPGRRHGLTNPPVDRREIRVKTTTSLQPQACGYPASPPRLQRSPRFHRTRCSR